MPIHTTNYTNTFIEVAEDCPAAQAEIPSLKGDKKTIARLQFEMVYDNPYKYTSDEVIFHCFAVKNDVSKSEMEDAKMEFFSKGQACMRASALTKRYGFGIHFNEEGKMAVYPIESEEYQKFTADKNLKHLKAMRSKKG